MTGQFLGRGRLIDIIKSSERTNALQKREGLLQHPVRFTVCGCPDPNCGGWHTVLVDRSIPTEEECKAILRKNNLERKSRKSVEPN